MHTQGGWEFIAEDGQGVVVYAIDPTDEYNGQDICEMCCTGDNNKEVLANARLICAAPELLKTLDRLERACTEDGVQGMSNLLAKARELVNRVKQ